MAYIKLFGEILDSTIWSEPIEIKITWITMLAMSDDRGEVRASIPGLAKRAGVTIEQCKKSLDCFLSPDPYSRSKEFDGKRIEEVDGGWGLLNHDKFRLRRNKEDKNEYQKKLMQKRRSDEDLNKKKTLIPKDFCLTEKMIEYAKSKNITDIDYLKDFTENFIDSCNAKGYKYLDFYTAWQVWLRKDIKSKPQPKAKTDFEKAVKVAKQKKLEPFMGAPYETKEKFIERVNS